jgi:hypothetical protein
MASSISTAPTASPALESHSGRGVAEQSWSCRAAWSKAKVRRDQHQISAVATDRLASTGNTALGAAGQSRAGGSGAGSALEWERKRANAGGFSKGRRQGGKEQARRPARAPMRLAGVASRAPRALRSRSRGVAVSRSRSDNQLLVAAALDGGD